MSEARSKVATELHRFDGEARRICDQRGLTEIDDFLRVRASLAYNAFREDIERFVRIKVDVYLSTMAIHIVHPDGHIERQCTLTPEQKEVFAFCDEMIASTAKRYGFEPSSERAP